MVASLTGSHAVGLSLFVGLLRLATLPALSVNGAQFSVEVSGTTEYMASAPEVRHVPAAKHEHTPALVRRDGSAAEELPLKVMYPEDHAALPKRAEKNTALPRRAQKRRFATSPIPGHCALPTMMEVEGASGAKQKSGIESCINVFEKARDITQVYIDNRAAVEANSSVTDPDIVDGGWVFKLKQNILAQTKGDETVADFDKVLDLDTLGTGLTHGIVWTSTDAVVWEECNKNQATTSSSGTDRMETQTSVGGHPIEQGDEYSAGDSLSMLIEGAVHHRRTVAVNNIFPVTSGSVHEIAYCFASSISAEARAATEAAVMHIEEQVPCIKFKPVSVNVGVNAFDLSVQENCAQFPSVIIQSHQNGCWSPVGWFSGRAQYSTSSQPINIGEGCGNMGIAAHELGHTLGLLHEMSRNDREKWVQIKEANIPTNMMSNFENASAADQGTIFDFLSLMMYGSYAFSTNGELTIEPHDLRLVNFMGQRMGFSELDVELMGNTYGCLDSITPTTKNKHLSQAYLSAGGINTGFTGNCADQGETGYVREDESPMPCSELKQYCAHTTLGDEIKSLCPVSCYMCQPGLDAVEVPLPAPSPSPRRRKSASSGKNAAGHVHGRPHLLGHIFGIFAVMAACFSVA